MELTQKSMSEVLQTNGFFAGICNFTKKIKHAHGTEISYLPRSNISRKYQLATPSPTKAKIKKRLLKSPQVSDEKPQKKFPTTVNVITVVTIPSFEELSRSKSVHEPAHVDIQCTIKYRVKCKEGKGCEKSFAIY